MVVRTLTQIALDLAGKHTCKSYANTCFSADFKHDRKQQPLLHAPHYHTRQFPTKTNQPAKSNTTNHHHQGRSATRRRHRKQILVQADTKDRPRRQHRLTDCDSDMDKSQHHSITAKPKKVVAVT